MRLADDLFLSFANRPYDMDRKFDGRWLMPGFQRTILNMLHSSSRNIHGMKDLACDYFRLLLADEPIDIALI